MFSSVGLPDGRLPNRFLDRANPHRRETSLTGSETHHLAALPAASAAARDTVVREYGAIEGGKQTLGRLAAYLPTLAAAGDFVITRTFAAPRALVWRAWTETRHLARRWGPRGFTNPGCELALRPGGAYRIVMRGADGVDYPITGVYREVVTPARLVMTVDCSEHPESWHDRVRPDRRPGENGASEVLQTVTFEDLGEKTRLTIRMRFESAAIRDAMVKIGMNEGWSQSLGRLAEALPAV